MRPHPYRRVDKINEGKETIQPPVSSKIEIWKKAWLACANVLSSCNGALIKQYHILIEKWIPLINKAHNYPIQKMALYNPIFVYCDKPNPLKEIISFYFDLQSDDMNIPMYIVFNVPLFKKLCNLYIALNMKNNQLNYDLDRGIVNLTSNNFLNLQPADYLKISTCWYLLFIAINHALSHLESFEKYDTASYNNHEYNNKSSFHKLYLYGRIKHTLS